MENNKETLNAEIERSNRAESQITSLVGALDQIRRVRVKYAASGFPVGMTDPCSWMEQRAEDAIDAHFRAADRSPTPTRLSDRALAIVKGLGCNHPHPDGGGKRIVGFVVDEETAGLSDAIFALDEIRNALGASTTPIQAKGIHQDERP